MCLTIDQAEQASRDAHNHNRLIDWVIRQSAIRFTPEERATWGSRTRVPIAWRREGRWVPFSDKCRPDPDDRIAVAVLAAKPAPTA